MSLYPKNKRPGRYLSLLIALIINLLLFPFLEGSFTGEIILQGLGIVSILTIIYAVSDKKINLVIAIVLAVVGASFVVADYFNPQFNLHIFTLPAGIAFYAFGNIILLGSILKFQRISRDEIYGVISVYLLFGINWTLLYVHLYQLDPASFYVPITNNPDNLLSIADLLYFSFVTLTTLGYGDITPLSTTARAAAFFEAIVGLLFIAVFIARMLILYEPAIIEEEIEEALEKTLEGKK